MTLLLGINGFGRIGRALLRCVLRREGKRLHQLTEPVEVVAINDTADVPTLAYLLEYDSTHGGLGTAVRVRDRTLCVRDHRIHVTSAAHPADADWRAHGAQVVVDTSSPASARRDTRDHLRAGARKVIVAAAHPGADATIAVGVNDHEYDPSNHHLVSAASGTAHCVALMLLVLDRAFGVRHGILTAIHSYTTDQSLLDQPHRDLRRARSAAVNIVPTKTGSSRAVADLLPGLDATLGAVSVRVPVEDGSLACLTVAVHNAATPGQVNRAFADAATGRLGTQLTYTDAPVVSRDIVGSSESCRFDAGLTTTSADLVTVFGWYDNECGYANRLLDLAHLLNPGSS